MGSGWGTAVSVRRVPQNNRGIGERLVFGDAGCVVINEIGDWGEVKRRAKKPWKSLHGCQATAPDLTIKKQSLHGNTHRSACLSRRQQLRPAHRIFLRKLELTAICCSQSYAAETRHCLLVRIATLSADLEYITM